MRSGIGLHHLVVAVYVGVNLAMVIHYGIWPGPHNGDWQLFLALRERPLYEASVLGVPFLYSPVAGWLLIGATYLGYWAWFALHFAAVWLIRAPMLILLTLISWGFWGDTIQGNAFVFVFVAGALALRGSRRWALVYVALCVLMPRPVQLPLLVYVLWTMPAIRWPAFGVVTVLTALAWISGDLLAWLGVLSVTDGYTSPINLSPVALVGMAWLLVGVPIGIWLLLRGMPGLAGLAVSPYNLPQYLLVGLWDVRWGRREPSDARFRRPGHAWSSAGEDPAAGSRPGR